jgi:hypothetical protein
MRRIRRQGWQVLTVMSPPLEPALAELLLRLVELDSGNYDTFVPHVSGESNPEAELVGHDDVLIPPGPTRELAARGFLNMEPTTEKLGKFSISERGRKLAAQLSSESEGPIDLSWSAVEPVLVAIHAAWLRKGAPPIGLAGTEVAARLELPGDQLSVILTALEGDDWIEYRQLVGQQLPQGIQPSAKAVRYLNRWPTGDARELGEAFLAHLDERIDAEPDSEEKSRLKATLQQGGTGFRELLVEVVAAIASRQLEP